jgi:hypothetical protein
LTNEEIDQQIDAAHRRQDEYRRSGLLATRVRYDERTHRLVLELTNGYLLGVPVVTLPELADATASQLRAVELIAEGAIEFESLDVQYSVPGLVMAMSARAIGRLGGKAVSPSKKRASRVNGKKGGRPRKASGA